jgi:chloramphenicol 3-O-phosphotransferase
LAKSQLETVHAGCSYDFELDTTSEEPAQLARRFVEWLRKVPTPSAFQLMERTNAA